MGKTGRAVVDLDVGALVADLRKASELAEHFKEEATDELGHAEKLANRIVDLGGDPVVHPGEWERGANAPFTTPRKEWADADGMVQDQLKAEAGAIQAYNRLAKMTVGKDPATYQLATELLADEVGHEEFLENLLGGKKAKV